MVNIEAWMDKFAGELAGEFGHRLLYLGVQGSYGRGEACEDSDIDVVTVLDQVELADLDVYKAVVSTMPEGEKACGFLCGASELKSWPKYDMCQLIRDVRGIYGELEPLLPGMGRDDLADAVAIGASGLYHAAVHTYLYGGRESWSAFLEEANKSAFFILRSLHEVRTGKNVRKKSDLLPLLEGDERNILHYSLSKNEAGEPLETAFARLIRWSGAAMAEAGRAKVTKFP